MISIRTYTGILIFLISLRIIMVIALMQGFPYIQEGGWYAYAVDYGSESFRLAKSLAEFRPVLAYPTLGVPIVLVPFIWIFKAKVIGDIVLPVTICNSIFLFVISIILIASIAKILSNEDRRVALISAGLWVIFPYLVYLMVWLNPHLSCIDIAHQRIFYLMWVSLSEHPFYGFSIILGVYMFIVFLRHKEKISYALLVGVLFGHASLVEPLTSTVIGISFILTFLFMKYIKAFIYSATVFGIFSIPQLIYNWYFNGSPFNLLGMGSQRTILYNDKVIPTIALGNIIFSINCILEKFDTNILWLLIILVLSLLISIIYILKKKDKSKILIIWILPYLCFIIFYNRFYLSILECILPVLPAIIIMFSIIIVDIYSYLLNLIFRIKLKNASRIYFR